MDLNCIFEKNDIEIKDINNLFQASENESPDLFRYEHEPIVSSDVLGMSQSVIYDGQGTLKVGKNLSLKEVETETLSITTSTATPVNFFCSSIEIPSLLNVAINSGSTSSRLSSLSFFFGAE